MMESAPPPMFIADALGLDFLNSTASPSGVRIEWLDHGDGFLHWLSQSGMVPAQTLTELRQTAGPGELEAIASQARELREWFRDFVLRHKGQGLASSALAELQPLNRLLARDETYLQLVDDNDHDHSTDGHGHIHHHEHGHGQGHSHGLRWARKRVWRSPESLLLPVAEAMGNVISHEDFTHIKSCEGKGCSMIFVDKTRGHRRRWCSMAVCGNRAKQAAHRSRLPE